jgi:6-phosphogluconolactonase
MSHDDFPPRPDLEPSVLESAFENAPQLAAALADSVAEELRLAVAERGRASLVVSGGTTPGPFFDQLSRQLVPWHKVTITLADERWVDPGDPASNEGLVRQRLLVADAAEATFVPLKNAAATPEQGQAAAEQALVAVGRPFDVVVLGLGADGHTASLFPNDPLLGPQTGAERMCAAVRAPDGSPRLTLTLAALLDSRRMILLFTGEEKWRVYRQALGRGPLAELPVRAVLGRGREPIDIYYAP